MTSVVMFTVVELTDIQAGARCQGASWVSARPSLACSTGNEICPFSLEGNSVVDLMTQAGIHSPRWL